MKKMEVLKINLSPSIFQTLNCGFLNNIYMYIITYNY